jgi:23S rRNA U2552 (ribose-2'-O)-methylase RlmE/FtsJ
MLYFTLPCQADNLYAYMDHAANASVPMPVISRSLRDYLVDVKRHVDARRSDWATYHIYINPYEFLCLSAAQPRAYFKLVEIFASFRIFSGPSVPPYQCIGLCRTCDCVARALPPGAQFTFIPSDIMMDVATFTDAVAKNGSAADLVIAGEIGDTDFALDGVADREVASAAATFGYVAYALCLQRLGGTLVLKLADSFNIHTLDLLYLLSSMYERVHIAKPGASHCVDSEKYVVCTGFMHAASAAFYPHVFKCFVDAVARPAHLFVHRFLSVRIPYYVLCKVEEINAVFGQHQLEHVQTIVSLIDNKRRDAKIHALFKQHTHKCVQWCMKHSVTYAAV